MKNHKKTFCIRIVVGGFGFVWGKPFIPCLTGTGEPLIFFFPLSVFSGFRLVVRCRSFESC